MKFTPGSIPSARSRDVSSRTGVCGSNSGKKANGRIHAFTLVEILFISAIVVVLVALLFPALQKTMESAKAATCASNLRTLGNAAFLWSNDNDGWQVQKGSAGYWPQALMPYLDLGPNPWFNSVGKRPPGPWGCPASEWKVTQSWVSDYAKNAVINDYIGHPVYQSFKYSGMTTPSQIIFLADMAQNPLTEEGRNQRGSDLSPGAPFGRLHGRHNGRANVLFYDGHVEAVIPKDFVLTWHAPPWRPQ